MKMLTTHPVKRPPCLAISQFNCRVCQMSKLGDA